VRLLLLSLFWWVLSQGEPTSWVIGIPTVLIATIVSLWLSASSSWKWRLNALPRFVSVFAYCSLKGGVDVARRACSPSLPIAPAMLDYSVRLREGTAQVFFANIVSLLPGTLSADIRGDTILVHVLDSTLPVLEQLQRLEVTVADLFGCPIRSENAEAVGT
jgi:multicomponent Na+:H+ antiporter subunit E